MKLLHLFLLSAIFLIAQNSSAQHYKMHPELPVDSSYAAKNELIKNIKKYPDITLVGYGDLKSLTLRNEIVYARYGQREMHLDLVQPKGKKNLPVVVLIHAGGWRSGEKNMDRHIAYELSRNGFATVCVEYRLSMEAKYPAGVQDVKTAIRWIRANASKYGLDGTKIAVLGTSAGGQLAALIGSLNEKFDPFQTNNYARYSDKVQATVDIDGVLAFIHPESSEGQDQPGKLSAATLWFGASSKENPAPFREASALTHVGTQSSPFLFINSAQPRFHAGRDDMIAKLDSFGIYHEVHTIDNTPHTFWLFHPWFDNAIPYVTAFLNKTLKLKK
jgi:acetyl esterase/lipase